MTSDRISETTITVVVPPAELPSFLRLLQEGVALRVPDGASVRFILTDCLGMSPEYIAARLSAVFLDGRPVDVIETAFVLHGSRLSLSGALPGLAGALMRRSGLLSPLRSSITHRTADHVHTEQQAVLWLRLFNTVLDEVGPGLLRRGVLVQSARLEGVLQQLRESAPEVPCRVYLGEAPIGHRQASACLSSEPDLIRVLLRASPDPEGGVPRVEAAGSGG